jgi:hypothetical protein
MPGGILGRVAEGSVAQCYPIKVSTSPTVDCSARESPASAKRTRRNCGGAGKREPTIDSIEVAEFELQQKLRDWLEKTAPAWNGTGTDSVDVL